METNARNSDTNDLQNKPCPVCSGTQYEWGTPGTSDGLYYIAPGSVFGFGGGEGLWARKCMTCGNVQLFSKQVYDPTNQ